MKSLNIGGFFRSGSPIGLCVILCAAIAPAEIQADSAPSFTSSPLFPLTQGLVPFADPAPLRLGKGELAVSDAFTWTNTLRLDNESEWPGYSLIVDGETLVDRLSVAGGLGSGVTVGGWCEGTYLWPGVFDGIIADFHHFFGFANQWRDQVPPNQLNIVVDTPAGTIDSVHESVLSVDSLGFKLDWHPPGASMLPDFEAMVKVPVSAPAPWMFAGLPAIELSSSYGFSWRFIEASAAVGLAWQDLPSGLEGVPLQAWLPQASARLFLDLTPDFSVGAVAAAEQSPFAIDEWYLGGIVSNVWFGASSVLAPGLRLETAMIEELLSWASIEVGFQAGLEWVIPPPRHFGTSSG